jgi:enoyl-CoA hydratase/carnithine racemase
MLVAGNSTVNEILKFDVDGHLATIMLNRPEAMNAQNPPLVQAMSDAFKTVRDTPYRQDPNESTQVTAL